MTEIERMIVAANGGKFRGAQTALAKKLKVNQGTVSRWCKGTRPDPDVQPKLAAALNLTQAALMALFQSPPQRGLPPSGVDMASLRIDTAPGVPVLGVVSADRFACAFDSASEDAERIPNPYPNRDDVFALKVKGDCMEPTLHDGEYVYMLAKAAPADKKIVLAQLDGECTLKRCRVISGVAWLVPDNKKYDLIRMTKHVIIKGVADGTYRRNI